LTIIPSSIPDHEKNRAPLISNPLWSVDVVLVLLAPAKKVVTHHAIDKHEEQDGQDHYKQEPCNSKPG
jgi:hypothetical protein